MKSIFFQLCIKTVLIPPQVFQELRHAKAPPQVRAWASQLPRWCHVVSVAMPPDAALQQLDAGESEAIRLAAQQGVTLLLMDDAEGRREALRRSFKVAGTVSILEKGVQQGLTDFHRALVKLDQTTFRLAPGLRQEFLRRNP